MCKIPAYAVREFKNSLGVYSTASVSLEAANLTAIKRSDLGHNDT